MRIGAQVLTAQGITNWHSPFGTGAKTPLLALAFRSGRTNVAGSRPDCQESRQDTCQMVKTVITLRSKSLAACLDYCGGPHDRERDQTGRVPRIHEWSARHRCARRGPPVRHQPAYDASHHQGVPLWRSSSASRGIPRRPGSIGARAHRASACSHFSRMTFAPSPSTMTRPATLSVHKKGAAS